MEVRFSWLRNKNLPQFYKILILPNLTIGYFKQEKASNISFVSLSDQQNQWKCYFGTTNGFKVFKSEGGMSYLWDASFLEGHEKSMGIISTSVLHVLLPWIVILAWRKIVFQELSQCCLVLYNGLDHFD